MTKVIFSYDSSMVRELIKTENSIKIGENTVVGVTYLYVWADNKKAKEIKNRYKKLYVDKIVVGTGYNDKDLNSHFSLSVVDKSDI
jgi:hypothetical protein